MRALVVYESMFGNTRAVAEAVAEGLAAGAGVEIVDVASAPAAVPDDVDLVVAGGPTHAFGLSRPRTRQAAAGQGAAGPTSVGLREWLDRLPSPGRPTAAATFTTRVSKPRVPGSGARAAGRMLRRLGFRPLAAAEDFWVLGTPGPIRPGEVDRARQWGKTLAARTAEHATGRPDGGR